MIEYLLGFAEWRVGKMMPSVTESPLALAICTMEFIKSLDNGPFICCIYIIFFMSMSNN